MRVVEGAFRGKASVACFCVSVDAMLPRLWWASTAAECPSSGTFVI